MSIDKSKDYWIGNEYLDLEKYIKEYSKSETYIINEIKRCSCKCGNQIFNVFHDFEEGYLKLICSECKEDKYIADSEGLEDDIQPKKLTCICKSQKYEIGIGFTFRENIGLFKKKSEREIKWITSGARCIKCGMLGCPADWKIDYYPSWELINNI